MYIYIVRIPFLCFWVLTSVCSCVTTTIVKREQSRQIKKPPLCPSGVTPSPSPLTPGSAGLISVPRGSSPTVPHQQNNTLATLLGLVSFTWNNVFVVCPCCVSVWIHSSLTIRFYCWVEFHWIDGAAFVSPSTSWWTFRWFPFFGYHASCCCEHVSSVCVKACVHF